MGDVLGLGFGPVGLSLPPQDASSTGKTRQTASRKERAKDMSAELLGLGRDRRAAGHGPHPPRVTISRRRAGRPALLARFARTCAVYSDALLDVQLK